MYVCLARRNPRWRRAEAHRVLLADIVARHPEADVEVLVTGSLHLVGGVLKTIGYNDDDDDDDDDDEQAGEPGARS